MILVGLLGISIAALAVNYIINTNKQGTLKKNIEELKGQLDTAKNKLNENLKTISELQENNKSSGYTNPIVSHMPMGVVLIDQNGSVVFANKYAESFLAVTPTIGKTYKEVLNLKVDGKQSHLPIESAFMGKNEIIPSNSELVTQRGSIPVNGNITVISDNGSKAILVTFFDDSKNVARIQEEKEFFSSAAHELRTPLTGISLTTSILKQQLDTLPREKVMDYLVKTGEAVEYLTKLVNDFLNLSRLDQGRMVVEKKSFNVVTLTDEVIREISPLVKQRGLFIQHETIEDAYRNVIGDPVKAKEILTNLISNSIKYTIQGGITISHKADHKIMTTRVSDTGNGITEDSRLHLFKRFSQVGVARQQSSSKSTGLGLYISKKIAQLMKGDVILESTEPGKGTTFAFTLPINLGT